MMQNQSLQLTLGSAATAAIAERSSASIAAEYWRYVAPQVPRNER